MPHQTVLVAQSDVTLLNLYLLILKRAGYEVTKADTPEALHHALKDDVFDVMIYDGRLDAESYLLRQYQHKLKQANTGVIVPAFDNHHVALCDELGLNYTTITPTAVTNLTALVEQMSVSSAANHS